MTNKKTFKEFIVKTEPFNVDLVSGFLWELPIDGITEENDFLILYSSEKAGIKKTNVELLLNNLVQQNLIRNFSVEEKELENKNWNEEWEKSINVIEVTERIIIKPTFKDYIPRENQIIITIDPKMSFGTGEHQTTKLVLKMLEKCELHGKSVLDIGTGTGVLAIAAVKLGAGRAVGIDNDEWCYENAIENCLLNSVSDKINIMLTEINKVEENSFDIILANIQKNVLMDIADEIKNRLHQNGLVLLSGLLSIDEKDICNHYNSLGFTLIQKEQMDEWIALLLKNNVS